MLTLPLEFSDLTVSIAYDSTVMGTVTEGQAAGKLIAFAKWRDTPELRASIAQELHRDLQEAIESLGEPSKIKELQMYNLLPFVSEFVNTLSTSQMTPKVASPDGGINFILCNFSIH